MKIFTYRSEDAPEHMRFAAIMEPLGPGTHWMTTGPTEERAKAVLAETWAREKARLEPKPRKPRAPKTMTQSIDIDEVL